MEDKGFSFFNGWPNIWVANISIISVAGQPGPPAVFKLHPLTVHMVEEMVQNVFAILIASDCLFSTVSQKNQCTDRDTNTGLCFYTYSL